MMNVKNYGSNQTLIEDSGCRILYSYETPVVLITNNRAYKTDEKWSCTTSKHMNKFLRNEGFDPKADVTLVPQVTLNEWREHQFITVES